jgi:hypothetical protein
MDSSTADRVEADLVSTVDRRRAEGVSVAAACREAGISTSTYYRRRRTGAALADLVSQRLSADEAPPATVGLLANGEGRSWPFTSRAPFYWDQVFADEMTDSFVRREFGRGRTRAPAGGALSALAAMGRGGRAARVLRRIRGYLPRLPFGDAAGPLAALALLALVLVVSGWMVSVASNPAAWIDPGQTRVADAVSPSGATIRP